MKFVINTTLVALKMEISMQHSWYLSSLLPMLLLVQVTLVIVKVFIVNSSSQCLVRFTMSKKYTFAHKVYGD